MHEKIVILAFLLLAVSTAGPAQIRIDTDFDPSPGTDTSSVDAEGLDMENKNTFRVLFSGNPGKAALYSLILPGAGQAYNKRYWKIPVIYAGMAAAGWNLYRIDTTFQSIKSSYLQDIEQFPGQPSSAFDYYIRAKKIREQAIFLVIGVHLFNAVEAYIDRHLIDFDTDENLVMKLKVSPDPISTIGFSFYYVLK